jgi:hypothetical protein
MASIFYLAATLFPWLSIYLLNYLTIQPALLIILAGQTTTSAILSGLRAEQPPVETVPLSS